MGEHPMYAEVRGVTTSAPAPAGTSTLMPRLARPTIRIVHIVAPEIIKTDATNFRELVQRLTGRQKEEQQLPAADCTVTVGVAAPKPLPAVDEERTVVKEEAPAATRKRPAAVLDHDFVLQQENKRRTKIKCEVVKVEEGSGFGFGGGDLDHGDMWMDLNPGAFLSFLEEDVFRGMADPDFLQPPGSSRMDFYGEMCASYLA